MTLFYYPKGAKWRVDKQEHIRERGLSIRSKPVGVWYLDYRLRKDRRHGRAWRDLNAVRKERRNTAKNFTGRANASANAPPNTLKNIKPNTLANCILHLVLLIIQSYMFVFAGLS